MSRTPHASRRRFLQSGLVTGGSVLGASGGLERVAGRRPYPPGRRDSDSSDDAAEAPEKTWERIDGSGTHDAAHSVCETSDGDYLVAGARGEPADAWVANVDQYGTDRWDATYGGSDHDLARAVLETSDGDYLFAGTTRSEASAGSDAWLVKLDRNGTEQWSNHYGDSLKDDARAVIETNDGGYLVAGSSAAGGSRVHPGAWLLKVDRRGSEQWNQTYTRLGVASASSVVEASDGSYVFAGKARFDPNELGKPWVVSVDDRGVIRWERYYDGTAEDGASSVVETSDGGYLLAGNRKSTDTERGRAWLAKLGGRGEIEWQQWYGGTEATGADAAIETSDGGYLLAGRTYTAARGEAAFLMGLDNGGVRQWEEHWTAVTSPSEVVETSDGGYLVAGTKGEPGESTGSWLVKLGGGDE